jgi:hypothetical protein
MFNSKFQSLELIVGILFLIVTLIGVSIFSYQFVVAENSRQSSQSSIIYSSNSQNQENIQNSNSINKQVLNLNLASSTFFSQVPQQIEADNGITFQFQDSLVKVVNKSNKLLFTYPNTISTGNLYTFQKTLPPNLFILENEAYFIAKSQAESEDSEDIYSLNLETGKIQKVHSLNFNPSSGQKLYYLDKEIYWTVQYTGGVPIGGKTNYFKIDRKDNTIMQKLSVNIDENSLYLGEYSNGNYQKLFSLKNQTCFNFILKNEISSENRETCQKDYDQIQLKMDKYLPKN